MVTIGGVVPTLRRWLSDDSEDARRLALVIRLYLDSPLTMDSMNLALVAWRSAFVAYTSLRSFASHSAFQFAKPAPAPVQNTCCQGSVEGGRGRGVSGCLGWFFGERMMFAARVPRSGCGCAVSATGRAPPRSRRRARARTG